MTLLSWCLFVVILYYNYTYKFRYCQGIGNGYAVAVEVIGIFGGVILHPLLYLYKPQKSTKC